MEYLSIEELIKRIESGNVEAHFFGVDFKENWQQAHGKDISAIGNCIELVNGWVVIGVNDKGIPIGHDEGWLVKTEQTLSSHILEYLSDSSAVAYFGKILTKGQCLFIKVKNTGDVLTWNKKAYKLVGTSSIEMKPDELLALSLKLPGTDFSKTKYEGDIDASLVVEYAKKFNETNPDDQLDLSNSSSNEILTKLGIHNTATAGILFGNFEFRLVHFDDAGEILDQSTHRGLYKILSDDFVDDIQSWTRSKASALVSSNTSTTEETPYPKAALREVLANTVAHTLYQKHKGDIVIELYPRRLIVKNNCSNSAKTFIQKWFSRTHKVYNKHLMNILRTVKISDELGTGKLKIFRRMIESGKREPIIEFEEHGEYGRWIITLYNEESNPEIKNIIHRLQSKFTNSEEWRMAIALLLWRNKKWSEIREYLDQHFISVAEKVIHNEHCPVILFKNSGELFTKRWASIALDGQITKTFSERDSVQIRKVLHAFSFEANGDGLIDVNMARSIIGLSNTQSERTQLSNLFRKWQNEGYVKKIKKGHWQFLIKPETSNS